VTLDRLDSGAVYDVAVEDARFAARFLPLRRDGWSPADTTITVATPATIEGRIVGADHQPIASSWVCVVTSETAGRETSLGLPRVPVAPDGSFTIGMLARGDVWLRFGVGTGGVERVVRVAAPSSGVELVTEGGPTLVFRFEGVREGQAASIVATLTTWAADGRSAEAAMSVAASPDGVVRFPGLPKDRRFTLHAVFGDGDLIGWIADLGVEPSPVVVRLVPGGTIRGTVRYPSVEAAADGAWIEVEGRGFRANASVKKDGAFELKAIPPGRWHVTAMSLGPNRGGFSLPGGAEAWRPPSAEAEASPGESIDLTLVTPGPR
jgi:hypothetical protein